MKKFFVVLFVVLFATTAYAVDFQTSGSYYARGSWISNDSGLQADAQDYMYYDHELDMTTTIVVDDNTKIIVNYEIQDSNWLVSNRDGTGFTTNKDPDDNIEFKRVFSTHTWTQTGTTLDLGLMTGGAWATDFANNANGRYRVKVTQQTPIGPLFAILEKNAELGSENPGDEDFEDDDGDTYYLAMVTKLGPVNVKPLFGYGDRSDVIPYVPGVNDASDGLDLITFQLGIDGDFGAWGFESDFVYLGREFDGGADADNFGAYAKAWFNAGPAKIYGLVAYGDEDEGLPFAMGDDFEPLTYWANWAAFGPTADQFSACTVFVLGLDYAATEKLSFNAAVGYIDSNWDDNLPADNLWEDADAFEIDLGVTYAISDAVSYSVQFAWTELDDDYLDSIDASPDSAYRLYHKFAISF